VYSILIAKTAEKDLNVLDHLVKKRVVEHILYLKENPRSSGVKKLKGLTNAWRMRIADIRVLYEIDDKKKEVKIYRIKHRSKVY